MSELCDFGLIGLAVMGENLAVNVLGRGFSVAVFNRSAEKAPEDVSLAATASSGWWGASCRRGGS